MEPHTHCFLHGFYGAVGVGDCHPVERVMWRRGVLVLMFAATACAPDSDANLPGNAQDDQPYSGIGEDEAIRVSGAEPFWGGDISDGIFTYTTPDNIDDQRIMVTRFAGRGGLAFSGEAEGVIIDLAITPASCSDGMSERIYPFAATLKWGEDQRAGCAWSDAQPFVAEGG